MATRIGVLMTSVKLIASSSALILPMDRAGLTNQVSAYIRDIEHRAPTC